MIVAIVLGATPEMMRAGGATGPALVGMAAGQVIRTWTSPRLFFLIFLLLLGLETRCTARCDRIVIRHFQQGRGNMALPIYRTAGNGSLAAGDDRNDCDKMRCVECPSSAAQRST